MSVTTIAGLLALPVLVCLAGGLQAAGQTAPGNIADTWYVVVRDGHDAQFVEALADHVRFRQRRGDRRGWRVYVPVVGDELDHYMIRFCCDSFADLDAYGVWTDEAETVEHWNDNVDPHVARYHHRLQRLDRPDSRPPPDPAPYRLLGVTVFEPGPATPLAAASARRALSAAARAAGWSRHWAWFANIGGSRAVELHVPFEDFAAMGEPGMEAVLAEHLGEEQAMALMQAFLRHFVSSRYTVYRYLSEVSMDR